MVVVAVVEVAVLSCSHLARRWPALERRSAWLTVDKQVKACSRETHSPSRASKIYGHKAFQITHIQTAVINIITVDDLSDFGKGQAFVFSISIFLLSFLFIVYFCLYVYFYFLLMLPSLVNKDV